MPRRIPTHRTPQLKPHARQRRPSAAQRGYGSDWQRIRKAYLRRYPWCVDPFGHHADDGWRLVVAEHVDHIVPLSAGGTHDASNLQGLCATCHRRKTVLHDGGFGRAKVTMTKTSPVRDECDDDY